MLNLQPLIARLVDDILCAVAELTLAELETLTEGEGGATAVRTSPPRHRPVAGPRGARSAQTSVHTRLRSPARARQSPATESTSPEPIRDGDITDPEQLLMPTPSPAATEQTFVRTGQAEPGPHMEPEEEAPASRVQHVSHHRTPLRAGESVARASAAGVVIRRAKRS
jgi:hypothetical protein